MSNSRQGSLRSPHRRQGGWPRALVWAMLCLNLATATGCVQRRFTIRSNPPGARVFVDNYEIGTTPCSHDFIYYGTREIRLVKDGYETLVVNSDFPTPWYEFPGLDFVSENVVPGEIRDRRVLDFQLQPQVIVPSEQLLGRAEELRRSRNPGVGGPPALPGAMVPSATVPSATVPPPSTAPLVVPNAGSNTYSPPAYSPPTYTGPAYAAPVVGPPPSLPPATNGVLPPPNVAPLQPSVNAGPPGAVPGTFAPPAAGQPTGPRNFALPNY